MSCFCEDSARQPLIHNNMLQIAAFKRFREIFRVNLRMAFRILVFIGPIRRRVQLLLGILRDGMVKRMGLDSRDGTGIPSADLNLNIVQINDRGIQ